MTFKPLNENDIVNTRTLLHEAIPLTGSIISGSYVTAGEPDNIKFYSHGMFQSVYDYPILSSSANQIFDVTCGVSGLGLVPTEMAKKKRNIYGQMAQVLMGYDATGSVQQFDEDGDLLAGGAKMNEVFVLPFSRLLVKDEIKKETFEMKVSIDGAYDHAFANIVTISDLGASTEYRVNSPAGEYGILYATGSANMNLFSTHTASINGDTYWNVGLIFYQAGIAVLTGSLFSNDPSDGVTQTSIYMNETDNIDTMLGGSSIDDLGASLLHRIENIQFNNTTELNSTVYFCRVNHNEFNYSSNPTYLSGSKIRVKTQATDEPVSYISTVGLYNDKNELLATAKLSEVLKKTPSTEFTIRTRIDY